MESPLSASARKELDAQVKYTVMATVNAYLSELPRFESRTLMAQILSMVFPWKAPSPSPATPPSSGSNASDSSNSSPTSDQQPAPANRPANSTARLNPSVIAPDAFSVVDVHNFVTVLVHNIVSSALFNDAHDKRNQIGAQLQSIQQSMTSQVSSPAPSPSLTADSSDKLAFWEQYEEIDALITEILLHMAKITPTVISFAFDYMLDCTRKILDFAAADCQQTVPNNDYIQMRKQFKRAKESAIYFATSYEQRIFKHRASIVNFIYHSAKNGHSMFPIHGIMRQQWPLILANIAGPEWLQEHWSKDASNHPINFLDGDDSKS